jgi:hypothetical protein
MTSDLVTIPFRGDMQKTRVSRTERLCNIKDVGLNGFAVAALLRARAYPMERPG